MSIQIIEGWDLSAGGAATGTGWTLYRTTPSTGRFGGSCPYFAAGYQGSYASVPLRTPRSNVGVCMGAKVDSVACTIRLVQWTETGVTGNHVELRVGSDHRLSVYRNGTLLGTGTQILTLGVWYGIEMWTEIADSPNGAVKVWINGNPDPDIDLSGIDTRNGGTGLADGWYSSWSDAGYTDAYFGGIDDVVLYDDQGGVNDTAPLGDLRVSALMPNGNGSASEWTGSDADQTNNYQLVDEKPPNGDTDYVEDATAGHDDLYAYENLPSAAGQVLAVQSRPWARKTDSGTRQIAPLFKTAGGTDTGATITLATTFAAYPEIREKQPGNTDWTVADVNAAEFGVTTVA